MNQSYWDTSSILADAVRIPCHVVRDCAGLAHLQGSLENTAGVAGGPSASRPDVDSHPDDLKQAASIDREAREKGMLRKNTRIDVPFWLAELLALHGVVDLSIPRPYATRVRNALDADARSVQLHTLNAWWYAVGVRLGSLMEASELVDVLQKTYSARISHIFSAAQHLAAGLAAGQGGDAPSAAHLNDNLDSLGGYAAVSMSAETIEFIHGLEESEVQLLRTAQESVANAQAYLASGR